MKKLHLDGTIQTYDRIAEEFAQANPDIEIWRDEFEYFKKLIKGKKVIDIGCGHGREAVLFLASGFDYIGIDASKNMLIEARKTVKGGKFILMDFYNLEFPDLTFDGFWAASSLLHVPRSKIGRVLKSVHKIIKDGGVGFISLKERKNLDEGTIKEDQYGGVERFFAFYGLDEFSGILEESGFGIIKSYRLKQRTNGKTKDMLCYFVRKK